MTNGLQAGRPTWRSALGIVVFGVAYFVTAHLGLLLAIPPGNVTAVWPPSGLAVAALWLGGLRLWPVVAVATFIVSLSTTAPIAACAGFAVGNVLEALAAVLLLRRAGFDPARMGIRDVVALVGLAASVATVIAAVVGSAALVVTGAMDGHLFGRSFVTWWVGDALGILLVAPLVLTWAVCAPADRRHRAWELAAILAATVGLGDVVLRHLPSSLYLTFPPLLWATVRIGLRGATAVTVAVWMVGTVHLVPETIPIGSLPVVSTLGVSQLYFAVLGVVGLTLGAAINERDRARRLARSREEWQRTVLDLIFDVVAVIDEHGATQWVTPSVTRVLGRTPDELMVTPMADLLHPDDVAHVREQLARVAARPGETARIRGRCRDAAGQWRVLESHVTNALDDPNVRGLIACARDVTTQAEATRLLSEARTAALESVRMRSEFLANVSHELRTPLNVVFGLTDMLLDEPLPTAQAEKIRTIRRSAASLLHLIDDILDLAKIDAGRLELRRSLFTVGSIVEESIAALRFRAEAKGLSLRASVAPSPQRPLAGDPDRVRQILLNYLSNAVKFTDAGSVTVSAAVIDERDDGVRVRFEVQDTGIGIPAERLHRLFLPFSQVDGSMSRRYDGTGLGLAISKQLAEMMGGRVGVSSMPGLGSIFWCEVPLEKPSQTGDGPRAISFAPPTGDPVEIVDR